MRGPYRGTRRRKRLLTHAFYSAALALTIALAMGPFGLISADAADRSRDGSFSSDTDVVSDDHDADSTESAGGSVSPGSSVETRTEEPGHEPRTHGDPNPNITICHANSSLTNIYENPPTVDANSIVDPNTNLIDPSGHGAHVGDPPGAFDPTIDYSGNRSWGDIIPPFDYDDDTGTTQHYPGLNWDAQGQAILNAGCNALPSLATPVKSAPASVAVGSTGNQFTISVTNNGANTANNVTVTDTVNAAFIVTAVTFTNPNGNGTCATSNSVSCNVGTLQPGQTAVVTITFSVAAAACPGPILNQAAAAIGTGTSVNSNQTSTAITGCPPPGTVDMSVSKNASATVTPGGQITYTITATNLGNAAATNVSVNDTLPAGTTFVNATAPAGWTSTTPAVGGTGTVTFTKASVVGGESAQFTIVVQASASAACGATISNTATVSPGGTISTNDSSTATTDVVCPPPPPAPAPLPPPGIDITKTGPATAKVGDTVTYTFAVVLASGSPSLTGVSVTDPICDPGTLAGPTGDDGDNVLEGGETWGFSCTHVVTAGDPDPLPNTATVCATAPGGGTVCDSDNHEVDITHPAIEVVKAADPTSGTAGTVITYSYTVTNSGDVPLFDVTVDDDVLGHICDIAVLQPQSTEECTGTYTIPAGSPSEITNIVIAGGTDPAGDLVEDQDDFTITVVAGTTVTKTPPGGVAFTGPATAIPIAALALLLLAAGSGLLWLGRRRGHLEGTQG